MQFIYNFARNDVKFLKFVKMAPHTVVDHTHGEPHFLFCFPLSLSKTDTAACVQMMVLAVCQRVRRRTHRKLAATLA